MYKKQISKRIRLVEEHLMSVGKQTYKYMKSLGKTIISL